jgi:uncharacterized membrane protein YcaP (DUF421 family)
MTGGLFAPHSLLFGNVPESFLLEAALRMLCLYLVLLLAMRVMGRRMSSQLNRNELLALVSLAAAIGPALQDPQCGLLPPLLIAVWVAALQRAIAWWTFRSRRFDELANGETEVLLTNGRIELDALRRSTISRERLFAELRAQGFLQLGAVERVYLEANGSFSVLPADHPRPGLSIVPHWDPELANELDYDDGWRVCERCGATTRSERPQSGCARCQARSWQPAVCRG